jgi:hypothetical protein
MEYAKQYAAARSFSCVARNSANLSDLENSLEQRFVSMEEGLHAPGRQKYWRFSGLLMLPGL